MATINSPEVAQVIKDMNNDELELVREANIAFKCSYIDCGICPFNYCDDRAQMPAGYIGCIFADAGTELSLRKLDNEG